MFFMGEYYYNLTQFAVDFVYLMKSWVVSNNDKQ